MLNCGIVDRFYLHRGTIGTCFLTPPSAKTKYGMIRSVNDGVRNRHKHYIAVIVFFFSYPNSLLHLFWPKINLRKFVCVTRACWSCTYNCWGQPGHFFHLLNSSSGQKIDLLYLEDRQLGRTSGKQFWSSSCHGYL